MANEARDRIIYHISSTDAWNKAKSDGYLVADSLETEGFIHMSTKAQVLGTLNNYFKETPEVLLLHIDVEKLSNKEALKYEESHPNQYYPHLYCKMNLEAVVKDEILKNNNQSWNWE